MRRRANRNFLRRFDDEGTPRAVMIEDDGRTAYAYLLENDHIVCHVWLYNVAETPETPEWNDDPNPDGPLLNPRGYCREADFLPRLGTGIEPHCEWSRDGVKIFFDDLLVARLAKGTDVGWSRLAVKSGPLARPLLI